MSKVLIALEDAKMLTVQVADPEVRNRLFRQLDSLHDLGEWEEGDEPVNRSSFQTFLKALLTIKPKEGPGLGLSHTGNVIAAWTVGQDRLTIEFMPNDRVRWALSRSFSGQTSVSELVEDLEPHHPEYWFSQR